MQTLPLNVSLTIGQQQPNTETIGDIFKGFIFNEERGLIRGSSNFSHETPDNLEKSCSYLSHVDKKQHKCETFRYDTGIWISTIIDEWDLVCDRAWLISFIQSLYMSGFIVSFLMFGYLSDRFGRWRSLLLGATMEVLSGFGCALSNSVTMFMVFKFLQGLGSAGRTSSSFLHLIEWVGTKWRMHASIMGSLGWVGGYCVMPWISAYFLHFRHMQLFICFYEIVFVLWLLCLPESPRWLLIHKRFDESYEVLLRAAKFNGLIREDEQMPMTGRTSNQQVDKLNAAAAAHELARINPVETNFNPDNGGLKNSSPSGEYAPLQPYTIIEYNEKFQRLVHAVRSKEFTRNENKLSFIDLFKWKNLRKYTLILCLVYGCNSFIYYGFALSVGDFGGSNLFIAFTIAGLAEIPGMAFAIICMKILPRKTANLLIFVTTGLLCALQPPLKYYNQQWLQQATMMIAKIFNTSSFEVIRYQSMELFPTSIRQSAHSSFCLAGRIGSLLAPFIKELSQVTNSYVPPAIYAFLCFSTALLMRVIPETKGSDLSDTLLEAENFRGTVKRQKSAPTTKSTLR